MYSCHSLPFPSLQLSRTCSCYGALRIIAEEMTAEYYGKLIRGRAVIDAEICIGYNPEQTSLKFVFTPDGAATPLIKLETPIEKKENPFEKLIWPFDEPRGKEDWKPEKISCYANEKRIVYSFIREFEGVFKKINQHNTIILDKANNLFTIRIVDLNTNQEMFKAAKYFPRQILFGS